MNLISDIYINAIYGICIIEVILGVFKEKIHPKEMFITFFCALASYFLIHYLMEHTSHNDTTGFLFFVLSGIVEEGMVFVLLFFNDIQELYVSFLTVALFLNVTSVITSAVAGLSKPLSEALMKHLTMHKEMSTDKAVIFFLIYVVSGIIVIPLFRALYKKTGKINHKLSKILVITYITGTFVISYFRHGYYNILSESDNINYFQTAIMTAVITLGMVIIIINITSYTYHQYEIKHSHLPIYDLHHQSFQYL